MDFEVRYESGSRPVLCYTGPTPTTKQEALDISIRKWEIIVLLLEAEVPIRDGGILSCGLCLMYIDRTLNGKGCYRCPVAKVTKQTHCEGSPYERWDDLMADDTYNRLKVAREELEFLKGLKVNGGAK